MRGGTDEGMFGGIHADARVLPPIPLAEGGALPGAGDDDGIFEGTQAEEGVIPPIRPIPTPLPEIGILPDSAGGLSDRAIFADEYPCEAAARHCPESVVSRPAAMREAELAASGGAWGSRDMRVEVTRAERNLLRRNGRLNLRRRDPLRRVPFALSSVLCSVLSAALSSDLSAGRGPISRRMPLVSSDSACRVTIRK